MMMTYFSIILTLTAISLALYVGYTLKKKADKTYEKFIFSGLLGFMILKIFSMNSKKNLASKMIWMSTLKV